ncbi:MAG: tail fiber domain-containing protein [Candidatus Acidiferrales bacterium]
MKSSNIWVAMLVVCLFLAPVAMAQQDAGSPIQNNSAAAPSDSTAVVPQLIKFNGTLLDADERPTTGMTGVTFALYSEQTGGASLWMETQNVKPDANGNYTVLLGAASKGGVPAELFATGEARWLGIQVEQRPELPRVMLLSVPYALKAGDAQTVGGLPPSAFVLAAPPTANATGGSEAASVSPFVLAAPPMANATGGSEAASVSPATSSDVTTTGGTVDTIPLFTTAINVQDSLLTQTGTTAINVVGKLNLPALGTATVSAGFNSRPQDFVASVFNSSTAKAVPQTFQWQAEPLNNDKSTATGTLNLLYASGTATPAATGLKIANNGQITFAAGQTFPTVTGNETVTGDLTASELISTVATGTAPLKVTSTTEVANLNASLLGGKAASAFAQLAAANTFTGNQTVNGNLSATGLVSGSSYYIGGSLFAFGGTNENAFLGFAGNTSNITTTTGSQNTAMGVYADGAVTTGIGNTASGFQALGLDNTGSYNTALGWDAGDAPNTTSYNTFVGANATAFTGAGNSLKYATAIGANTLIQVALNNATAIGANAEVTASNALVLGSINGVNGATANTNVGIGTTSPLATLHLDLLDHGSSDSLLIGNTSSKGLEFYDSGAGVDIRSFVVPLYINYAGQNTVLNATGGRVGIGTGLNIPTNLLTLVQGGGPAIADGWNTYSSRRWKTNIQPLQNALGKIEQLRGVSYDLKESGKHEIGVIAEEVGAVVPEVVSYEQNGKDATGVDYSRLTALLIEAVKQQQREVKQQQREIRDLKSELRTTRQTLQKVQAQVAASQPTLVATK